MSAPLLVFGWGNASLGNDALGPLFVERLKTLLGDGVEGCVDFLDDYPLQIEHALDLVARTAVLFVEAAAVRERFARVTRLGLQAGALAGVEPQSLRFALSELAPGTCPEGEAIPIVETPGTAWGAGCVAEVRIDSRIDACPRCGAYPLRTSGGTDLRVLDLLVRAP